MRALRTVAAFGFAAVVGLAPPKAPSARGHKHAPLPPRLLSAKTVYLDNRTGYEKFSDRAYDELQKWGRLRVVDRAKDADLVLLLSATVYNGGYVTTGTSHQQGTVNDLGNVDISGTTQSSSHPVRVGVTHLYVIDPGDGEILWSDSKRWGNLFTGFRSATRSLVKEFRARIDQSESR